MIAADPIKLLAAIDSNTNPAKRFAIAFARGSVTVEMYAPKQHDLQKPHEQDELYVVYRGNGDFVVGGVREHFATGNVFFVPAGVRHRFENFSSDFATWVIFCGPKGGEQIGDGR